MNKKIVLILFFLCGLCTDLIKGNGRLPLFYDDGYNISFGIIDRLNLHPFDGSKYKKVMQYVLDNTDFSNVLDSKIEA